MTHSVIALCGVLLLSLLTVADAAPTVTSCGDNSVTSPCLGDSDTYVTFGDAVRIVDCSNPAISRFAETFLMPPERSTSPSSVRARSLPTVPGTLLMVLAGFVCVSLVRDRRAWLAVLAGVLWVGHVGAQTVPKLVHRVTHINHTAPQTCAKIARFWHVEMLSTSRGDIEGTRYAGLLHHLAGIPEGSTPSLSKYSVRKNPDISAPSQYALACLPAFAARPIRALAAEAEQFTRFSPAFIFDNLARAPPKPASKQDFR